MVGAVYGAGSGPVALGALAHGSRGGGIYGPAEASVYDSLFRLNDAARFGGGLAAKYQNAYLFVSNGQIDNNLAGTPSALPLGGGSGGIAGGGGVAALYQGTAYLTANSAVVYNDGDQGGGMLAAYGGAGFAADSNIAANTATYGGGVMAGILGPLATSRGPSSSSYIILLESSLGSNQAEYGGGGMSLYDASMVLSSSVISGNSAGQGGGALAYAASLSVEYSEISYNSATVYGGGLGGLYAGCELNVIDSLITNNEALNGAAGGGVATDSCEAYLGYSAITDNQATYAGGLLSFRPPATPIQLLNTTVSGNTAEQIGGIYAEGLSANFLTVADNLATGPARGEASRFGRGVFQTGGAFLDNSAADVQIQSTIFSNNTGPSGPVDLDVTGTGTATMDYSLVQFPGSGVPAGTGNVLSVDPQLTPLADHGGFTPTHALSAGSPAIDAANPVTAVEFDQRRAPYRREFDGTADMGAFEFFVDAIFSDRFEQP